MSMASKRVFERKIRTVKHDNVSRCRQLMSVIIWRSRSGGDGHGSGSGVNVTIVAAIIITIVVTFLLAPINE